LGLLTFFNLFAHAPRLFYIDQIASQVLFAKLRGLIACVTVKHCIKGVVWGVLDAILVGVTILLNCHIWALSHAGRHIRRALVNICNYCLLPGGNRLRVALKRECNRNASLFRFEEHLLVHELWLFEEVRMLYTLAFVTQSIEGWQLQLKFRHSVCKAYLLSTRLLEQRLAVLRSL